MTALNGFRCKRCGMVCISRHVHDFQSCECGNFTDGGNSYRRCGGDMNDFEWLEEEPIHETD